MRYSWIGRGLQAGVFSSILSLGCSQSGRQQCDCDMAPPPTPTVPTTRTTKTEPTGRSAVLNDLVPTQPASPYNAASPAGPPVPIERPGQSPNSAAPRPTTLPETSAPATPAPIRPAPLPSGFTVITVPPKTAEPVPPTTATPPATPNEGPVPAGELLPPIGPPERASVLKRLSHTEPVEPPCGHAPDYSWLVGMLEPGRQFGTWSVRFCPVGEEDRCGGSVTLLEPGPSEGFRLGRQVRVEGALVRPDGHELKPLYRVEKLLLGD